MWPALCEESNNPTNKQAMIEYQPKKFFFRDGSEMNFAEVELLYNSAVKNFKETFDKVYYLPDDPLEKLTNWVSLKGMKELFESRQWGWRDSMYSKDSTYMRVLYHAFQEAFDDSKLSYDSFFKKVNELREERRCLMLPGDVSRRLVQKLACAFCLFVRRGEGMANCSTLDQIVHAWLSSPSMAGFSSKVCAGSKDRKMSVKEILMSFLSLSFIKDLSKEINNNNPLDYKVCKTDSPYAKFRNLGCTVSDLSVAVNLMKWLDEENKRESSQNSLDK